MPELELKPLTTKQIHEKHEVKNAYCDFWNNIKFKKGWEKPAIELHDVDALLDKAADIVVRIRGALDKKDPSIKLRMIDGSAREFLWTQDENALQDPNNFVRELVHETFKDANGYVEGLTAAKVDNYIKQINQYHSKEEKECHLPYELIKNIRESWTHVQATMQDVLASPTFSNEEAESSKDATLTKAQVGSLQSVLNELEKLKLYGKEFLDSTKEQPKSTTEQQPSQDLMVVESEDSSSDVEQDKEDTKQETEKQPKVEEMQDDTTETSKDDTTEEKPSQQVQDEPQIQEVEVQSPSNVSGGNTQEESTVQSDPIVEEPETPTQPEVDQKQPDQVQDEQSHEKVEEMNEPTEKPKDNSALVKIKVVAEGVDSLKKDIKSLHDIADKWSTFEDVEQLPDAKKTVESLQKKCLMYTEKLLKDLMSLDEIVNTPEARPLRKQQVQAIQSMMEEVDNINVKLRSFLKTLQEREEQKKAEAQTQAEADKPVTPQPTDTTTKHEPMIEEEQEHSKVNKGKKHEKIEDSSSDEEKRKQENKRKSLESSEQKEETASMWKAMRLRPKMDVNETRDAYVISSYIPGMKQEDIEVHLTNNKRAITISGLRVPSPQEEKQLKKLVANRIRSAPFIHPDEDIDTLLLKAGAGRYGRFEESYELPPNVDGDSIEATYERGVLRVVIPKLRQRRPHSAYPTRSTPFGYYNNPSNFYNDRDFWW